MTDSPRPTGFVYHPDYLLHVTPPGHSERPERLTAIMSRLKAEGILERLQPIAVDPGKPEPEELKWIARVHPDPYLDAIRAACAEAPAQLDEDTPVSHGSYHAARLAVAGTLAACDAVMRGQVRNAFCAVRPPGHHAETQRAMGFCLFNNVAVAARYLQEKHGLKRILIIDWDVHHGNGTQEIFYADSEVFYFSTHQFPYYPGTGARAERGVGRGEGATLNVPLAAGAGDAEYISVFENELGPAARAFRPDFVLISAGFDAHRADPLGEMQVTEKGFARLTELVMAIAREHCGDRIVSVLEGGYDLDALAASVAVHVEVLRLGTGSS